MNDVIKNNFESDVLNSNKTVLVDVWADWCPPCRGMMPIVESLAEETKDWADVVKIDASSEMELLQELGVTALPTFLVYKKGELVNKIVGATSKNNLLEIMK